MRIPSGKTDQVIYFVAVDSADLKTRETGLSSFTVYRSRNGGAATAYTTPTVSEISAANMPGVYSLLIDEDTTIAAGSDSEEYVVHITQAAMAPVTRTIELYRRDTTSGQTITVSSNVASANTVAWNGAAVATPTVAGVPEVNITHIAGAAVNTASAQLGVNVVNAAGTAWNSGAITAASIATGAIDADALANSAVTEITDATKTVLGIVTGTTDSGTTTTMVDAARSESSNDHWKGALIVFTSGTISGQARRVIDFEASSDTITFFPATTAAVGTNTYILIPDRSVWDEDFTQHVAASSFGKMTETINNNSTFINNALRVASGTSQSGTTTTFTDIFLTQSDTDHWKGCYVVFDSNGLSAIAGQTRLITGFDPATDTITFSPATTQAVSTTTYDIISNVASPTAAENATAVATTAMAEAYSTDGGTVTLAQGVYELLARDQEISISGTTMTVKKRDGTTTAYTLTLNDATSPTAVTRSG